MRTTTTTTMNEKYASFAEELRATLIEYEIEPDETVEEQMHRELDAIQADGYDLLYDKNIAAASWYDGARKVMPITDYANNCWRHEETKTFVWQPFSPSFKLYRGYWSALAKFGCQFLLGHHPDIMEIDGTETLYFPMPGLLFPEYDGEY